MIVYQVWCYINFKFMRSSFSGFANFSQSKLLQVELILACVAAQRGGGGRGRVLVFEAPVERDPPTCAATQTRAHSEWKPSIEMTM